MSSNKVMTELIIAVNQTFSTRAAEGTWTGAGIPSPAHFPLLVWALNAA